MKIYILKGEKGSYEDYSTWDIKAYLTLAEAEVVKQRFEEEEAKGVAEAEEYIKQNKGHKCKMVLDENGNKFCEICYKLYESRDIADVDEIVRYRITELELEGLV